MNEAYKTVWLDKLDPQVYGDIAPDGFALPVLELTHVLKDR